MTEPMNDEPGYIVAPARYAKGMMAVRCPSNDGYKTRAARLAGYFAGDRYSNRERAYIMSRAAAEKFEHHYANGYSASFALELLLPEAGIA